MKECLPMKSRCHHTDKGVIIPFLVAYLGLLGVCMAAGNNMPNDTPGGNGNPAHNGVGFVGEYSVQQDRSGLKNMGNRQYDPETGRFLSRDPLVQAGLKPGTNAYVYAGNNPVNLIDPDGLEECAPQKKSCWSTCMSDYGAGTALAAIGVSSPAVSIPKPFGAGSLGSGSMTTALSIANYAINRLGFTGTAARALGRTLNPVANVVAAGAAGYLAGLTASCALQCSGF
jgi:RHS repeat-associated protein